MQMTRLTTSEVRDSLAETLNRVAYQGIRVIINRRGGDLAALVPMSDFALLQELENRLDLEAALKALREVKEKGTVPWEDVKGRIGL